MIQEFDSVHEEYIEAWNYGWKTGDPSRIIPFISENYFGTWCSQEVEAPEILDYRKLVGQIGPAIREIPGAIQTCASKIVKRHGDSEVIVGYLKKILNSRTQKEASSIQIEVWKEGNGKWKLTREYVEV